jgi:hypothetical protein
MCNCKKASVNISQLNKKIGRCRFCIYASFFGATYLWLVFIFLVFKQSPLIAQYSFSLLPISFSILFVAHISIWLLRKAKSD